MLACIGDVPTQETIAAAALLREHVPELRFRVVNVEQGTTTTPFDMVVLNEMSRYHLVLNALRRARRIAPGARALERLCEAMLLRHHEYIREHFEDIPEVREWTWPGPRAA